MARLGDAQVKAYIKRATEGGWLKKSPEFRKVTVRRKSAPDLEALMQRHLDAAGITIFEREVRFVEDRAWRFDFATSVASGLKVAVEVEGGIYCGGRHVRPKGFREDARKYRRAAIEGWIVLRVTAQDINDGSAMADIIKAIEVRTNESR